MYNKINAEYNTGFLTRTSLYMDMTDVINNYMTINPKYIYEHYEHNEYLINTTSRNIRLCIIEYGSFNYSTYYTLEETLDMLEANRIINYSMKNLFLNLTRKFPDKIPLIDIPSIRILLCPHSISDMLTTNRIAINVLKCDVIYHKIQNELQLRTAENIILKQNQFIVVLIVVLIIMGYLLIF